MENDVLYRYLKGETTPDEEQKIAAWLEADFEAHQEQLDAARFIFEGIELYKDDKQTHKTAILTVSWRRFSSYAIRIAAVVVIAMFTAFITHRQAFKSMSDMSNIVYVPAGQRMELTLSDGTHVWLNSGAELEYPAVFGRNSRLVKLSGEAMFQVERDEMRPFTVETFASDIQVLGTKFNVNADEKHNDFTTTLLEGTVRVSNRIDPSQPGIVLTPNKVVSLIDGKLHMESLRQETEPCWVDGLLSVTGFSFSETMDKFEQVFGVHIVIERNVLPEMENVGGKIRINNGIEHALRILQYGVDFSYEIEEATNTVIIR